MCIRRHGVHPIKKKAFLFPRILFWHVSVTYLRVLTHMRSIEEKQPIRVIGHKKEGGAILSDWRSSGVSASFVLYRLVLGKIQ